MACSAALCAALAVTTSAVAQQSPAPPQAAPPSPPKRVEIISHDGWQVTCRYAEPTGGKRQCAGELKIFQSDAASGQARVVFTWVMGLRDGQPASAFQVPTGVQIGPGVEMKLGKESRKAGFLICEPSHCEVAVPLDEAFVKAVSAVPAMEASIVATDGRVLKFTINTKGFDKALGEIRK